MKRPIIASSTRPTISLRFICSPSALWNVYPCCVMPALVARSALDAAPDQVVGSLLAPYAVKLSFKITCPLEFVIASMLPWAPVWKYSRLSSDPLIVSTATGSLPA